MAKVKQSITTKAKNNNAKYKIKYTYSQKATTTNGLTTLKYTYSKLISSLSTNKYSYAI